MYIGVDLGGTKISASLVDAKGKIKKHVLRSTPKDRDEVLDEMCNAIDNCMNAKVKGIGIGVPGVVYDGKVPFLFNIDGFKNFSFQKFFEKKYKLPVRITNDTNCFLLGEHLYGAVKKEQTILALTIGTGLGCAVMTNGVLLEGSSGEIGHTYWGEETNESVVSGPGLIAKTGKSPKEVLKAKDAQSKVALEYFYERLSNVIAFGGSLLDVESVVLGGSVGRHLNLTRLKKLVNKKIPPSIKIKIIIQNAEHPGSVGAASLVMGID